MNTGILAACAAVLLTGGPEPKVLSVWAEGRTILECGMRDVPTPTPSPVPSPTPSLTADGSLIFSGSMIEWVKRYHVTDCKLKNGATLDDVMNVIANAYR